MKISKIRETIYSANWSRQDSTGGTREECRRCGLPCQLLPHLAALDALQIPARFADDLDARGHAIWAIGVALVRWQEAQNVLQFPQRAA